MTRAITDTQRDIQRKPKPHEARQLAESFGADPELYDRTRPRYPQALVNRIIASSPGPRLLDVGIGTGIAARPFRAAGCRVLGVDVDARMADFARSRGFEVEVARFEEWQAAGRTFDMITAGMTWHWVDPLLGAIKAAELLRRAGRLAVFWNVQQPPRELAQAFSAVYRRVVPNTPFATTPRDPADAYASILVAAATGIRASGKFDEPENWQVDWDRHYTKDEWLEQLPSFGGHSQFTIAQIRELLSGIGAAIDRSGGTFTMNYASVAVTATRSDET